MPTQSSDNDRLSVIIVEVLGYGGGGEGDEPTGQDDLRRRRTNEQRSQNPDSAYQVLGAGNMTAEEARKMIAERRQVTGR